MLIIPMSAQADGRIISMGGVQLKRLVAVLLIAVLCISFVNADTNRSDYRIKINTASRTLKLYKSDTLIKEFPIAAGKPTTKSPEGSFRIISKVINPWWGNHGNPMPPGPNNPLGIRWMGLSTTTGSYGIHGNSTPSSIATFASGGCIRMFNSDVEKLFSIVSIGTPVQMVYENLELVLDRYTNTPVLVVYPNTYKQKNAEAIINKLKTENNTITSEQAAKAIKLTYSSIKNAVAVSQGTPMFLNNQFITNDAFIENNEAYLCSMAALDFLGLDQETIASLNIKTMQKENGAYINLIDAVSKIGGEVQYDKINNNIYLKASIVKVNGKFLSSYNGGFDKEYSLSSGMLAGISRDIIPAFGTQKTINLKDFSKERSWGIDADSLHKVMNIEIPLKVKAEGKLLGTICWNNKHYLKYDDLASIPGILNEKLAFNEYNSIKYIDLDALLEGYEYQKDGFNTVIELIKPLEISEGNTVK